MEERITSRENRWIKTYRKLCGQAKERRETGLFAVEGLRLCGEAIRCGLSIPQLFLTSEAQRRYGEALKPLLEAAERVFYLSDDLGALMGDTKTPQGVFAVCRMPKQDSVTLDPQGRYLLLENIQDPGNLGTMIRTADAFGITALVLSAGCTDSYAPRVLRAAMGSAFRLPLLVDQDLGMVVAQMRSANIAVYAATLNPDSVPVWDLPKNGVAVAVGNEGNGVTPELIAQCEASVHIPMKGEAESLNAATAAAILLWEISGRI